MKAKRGFTPVKLQDVRFEASFKFDMREIERMQPNQIRALMRGVAEVLQADAARAVAAEDGK